MKKHNVKTNKHRVTITTAIALLFTLVACAHGAQKETRPNIILILADDLGYADVGFNGSPDILTPNLDSLANNGIRFSQAYAAHPFCGPSRAGLLTGRYPHKFGSQFNLPDIPHSGGLGVPVSETYISEVLKQAGYLTGVIGKWHLGEAEAFHPNNRGFDEFYGFLPGGHHYHPSYFNARVDALRQAGRTNIHHYLQPLEHNGVEVREEEYLTDGLSREAVNFVAKAHTKKQPFFLYLAYNAPHTPLEATEADMAMFPHIKDKNRKTYAGMVYAVDRGVKRVVDELKRTGEFDNTLIVFMSDNGGKLAAGANNGPLRAGKGSVYEGGHRSPMFFHWPKNITTPREYTHLVHALDFFPTFAGLAQAEVPKALDLDGKNIWPAIQKNTAAHKDESYFVMRHRGDLSDVTAHREQWKAVRVANGPWALYDVSKDPEESNDLSKDYPDLLIDMVAEMNNWSWTHQPPRWFHIHEEGVLWREASMPRFHETFNLPVQGAR